jgi:hypothetical protein
LASPEAEKRGAAEAAERTERDECKSTRTHLPYKRGRWFERNRTHPPNRSTRVTPAFAGVERSEIFDIAHQQHPIGRPLDRPAATSTGSPSGEHIVFSHHVAVRHATILRLIV